MEFRSKRIAVAARPSPEVALYFENCYCLHGEFESSMFGGAIEALSPKRKEIPQGFLLDVRDLGLSSTHDRGFVVERSLQILRTQLELALDHSAAIARVLDHLSKYDAGSVVVSEDVNEAYAELAEQGYFSWKEWSEALSSELAEAARQGELDDGSRYYEHWLAALETLSAAKGIVALPSLAARKEEWLRAYARTPHGEPVRLGDVKSGR